MSLHQRRSHPLMLEVMALLAGCATAHPPPSVQTFPSGVGSEIQLLQVPTRLMRVALDSGGVGHIVAVDKNNQLHHVTVTPAGTVATEVLGPVEDGAKVDIAADSAGAALHILAGSRYLSGRAGQWKEGDAGRCEQLAAVGSDIVCAFGVRGGEVEAPLQFGLAILPGGLPIPLVLPAHKVVLAKAESGGWRWFGVIEPTTGADVRLTGLIADNQGRLRITYDVEGILIRPTVECRYAIVEMPHAPDAAIEPVTGRSCEPARSLKAVAGGNVLMASSTTSDVYIGSLDRAPAVELPTPACNNIEAAGFGSSSFQILPACTMNIWSWSGEVALFYTLYAEGSWRTPVQLTAPGDIAFGTEYNARDHGFRILAQGTGRALAVVALANGRLVARWIDMTANGR